MAHAVSVTTPWILDRAPPPLPAPGPLPRARLPVNTQPVIVAGPASFSTASGNITLANAGNSFNGAVSLTASGAGNVALSSNSAVSLGNVSVANGTLMVTAAGNLSQAANASINVAGNFAASFASTNGSISLNGVNNAFAGRKYKLTLIDAGHWLLVLLIMGAIVGWKGVR